MSELAPAAGTDLPLFPLPVVLFPDACLPLRIFETRYLNLVRDCGRTGSGFGVVHYSGTPESPGHAGVGTEALIEDFTTLDDGLLGIQCRGRRKFRIVETRSRDDGLLIGRVEWLAREPRQPVPPQHAALQSMLRELLRHQEFTGIIDPDPDDASSLGMALSSVVPLEAEHAQSLLEVTDPIDRLDQLVNLIGRLGETE